MPNHTQNLIKVTNQPPEEVMAKFISDIFKLKEKPDPHDDEFELDFNILVPMPELLRHSGKGACEITNPTTGEKKRYDKWYVENPENFEGNRPFTAEEEKELKEIGYDDWYEWSCANWGTKWNAYGLHYTDFDEFRFETAWSPPEPWLGSLAVANPEVVFQCSYIDEGWGFAGTNYYSEGALEDQSYMECDRRYEEFQALYEEVYGFPLEYDEDEEEDNDDEDEEENSEEES